VSDQTPSKRRFQKTRQGILDAARSIIVEQGVHALSMRSLAEKVDYSASAIYKYFENKEEIISVLRQEGWEISARISQAHVQPGMTMKETFVQMGLGYLEFARAYPAHYELIMTATDDIPNDFNEFVTSSQISGLMGFTTMAIESGTLILPEGYQPIHLAFLMWFLGHGAAMIQNTILKNCPEEFMETGTQVFRMVAELFKYKE
jgi:AcrR family transcriptional regulator